MERPGDAETVSVGENQILMSGFAQYEGMGTRFASVLTLKNSGGEVMATENGLTVKNASEVEILISGRTSYWGGDEVKLRQPTYKPHVKMIFKSLKNNHIAHFHRCSTGLNWR